MKNKSRKIATSTLVLSFVLFVVALLMMKFIPIRYKLITFLGVIALTMFALIATRKVIWRFTLAASILIISGGLVVSQFMLNRVSVFKDHEIVEYVVIKAKVVSNTESKKEIGFYGVKFEDTKKALDAYDSRYAENKITPYVNAEDVIYDLQNGHIDQILTQTSVLSDLKFFATDFDSWAHEVDRFSLNESRPDITKPVDVMKDPFVVYVSGIDVFGDVVTRSRSDLNMLIVVNPSSNEILTVSIPRDTYVPLGCENGAMDKLTHAGLYGVSCSVKTLETLLGVDINYYLRLNFTGLVDIVDEIGGVDVYSQYDFVTDAGDEFNIGLNHVDGQRALVFARERTNISYGDVSRGMNHQALAKALFSKMISSERMAQLPQLSNLLQSTIDMNFTSNDISNLISSQIDNGSKWNITDISLDGEGAMEVVHSLDSNYMFYVYKADKDSLASVKSMIQDYLKVVESEEAQ